MAIRKANFMLATALSLGGLVYPLSAQTPLSIPVEESRLHKSSLPMNAAQARWLEATLELSLLADPATFHAQLKVTCQNSILVVEGNVVSEIVHQKVLHLVTDMTPLPVKDLITVRVKAMPTPEDITGAKLTEEAARLIHQNVGNYLVGLQVSSDDGKIITVKGEASSLEDKLEASKSLRQLSGCLGVDNKLTVAVVPSGGKLWNRVTRDGKLTIQANSSHPGSTASARDQKTTKSGPIQTVSTANSRAEKANQSGPIQTVSAESKNDAASTPTPTPAAGNKPKPAAPENQRVHRWSNSKSTDQNPIQQVGHKEQNGAKDQSAQANTQAPRTPSIVPPKTTWTVIGQPSTPAPSGEAKAKPGETDKQSPDKKTIPATTNQRAEAKPDITTIPAAVAGPILPSASSEVSVLNSASAAGVVLPSLGTKTDKVQLTSYVDDSTSKDKIEAKSQTQDVKNPSAKGESEKLPDPKPDLKPNPAGPKTANGSTSPIITPVAPVIHPPVASSETSCNCSKPGCSKVNCGCDRPGGLMNTLLPFGVSCQAIPRDTPPATQAEAVAINQSNPVRVTAPQPHPVEVDVVKQNSPARPTIRPVHLEESVVVSQNIPSRGVVLQPVIQPVIVSQMTPNKVAAGPVVVNGYIVSSTMAPQAVETTRAMETIRPVTFHDQSSSPGPSISKGRMIIDSDEMHTPEGSLAESRRLLQLQIEKLAKGQAWNIEVVGFQGHGMVIKMMVASNEAGKRIREQIMELPDMKLMNVHMELKVAH